ncbi:unnamed protein product [Rotaria magnacalcarata]|uniref:G-protein coupled receptors family 1 profile domain-containing protein n=1 Tax=Rotaria magnacalcarata TaxID=392030 RepID=A0A816VQJ8_9BILA|nr:unnamed protein product [Rotaria magnacalcarata]CAF1596343.1 unnamed protein product [Rotaria magnacalcarata]CAF2127620.1 unnamed protein product [Rotaria magnacalcarata]CAF3810731.1 unnamed protein product [Rotaria magnacalcarata]CAF3924409.1 unnamed protein product [Rotaria magnacalcarata]
MNGDSNCTSNNDSYGCNNSSNTEENNFFLLIFSIPLAIIMILGVIGNLLVIYVVLNYGRLKTVTNTYLLHLALSDLVFLSGIPFFTSSLITRAWIFGGFACKLFFLTQGVNQYTSIIILALLAFDRYLAVCYSAKSIGWRSHVNPNLLLILTWILSFILMLPIIAFTAIQSNSPSSKVQCIISFPNPDSSLLYMIFVVYTSAITFVLPLSLMVYFYIRIVCRLKHKVSQQHRRSRASVRTRRKVSVLVLVVISVHILCCSPYWAFQMLATSELLPQQSSILLPISSVAQFLLFVNSATNPIVYAFLSEIFRLSFKHVFYCCLSTHNDQYLQVKRVSKKSVAITVNQNNIRYSKNQNIPMRSVSMSNTAIQSKPNQQRLSLSRKQSNSTLVNKENRCLSIVPTTSIVVSEMSYGSES